MIKTKGIFAFSILLLYAVFLVRPYLPFINYAVNKDYIANTLCENKNKPEKNCCGKCQLEKELKKTANEESKPISSQRINIEDYIAINSCDSYGINQNLPIIIRKIKSVYSDNYSYNNINLIFHPPQV